MSKICIVGSLNTEVLLGPVDALPRWGTQVLVEECDRRAAGSAVCAALPLAALGVQSTIVGCVGDDAAGRAVIQRIKARGLPVDAIHIVADAPTGICVSVFRRDGERAYVSALGALEKTTCLTVEKGCPQDADTVLLTGLFVLPGMRLHELAALFGRLKDAGKTTCLDTGWDTGGWGDDTLEGIRRVLAHTHVFLPNADEARAITGESTVRRAVQKLRAAGPQTVIVKQDRKGASGLFGDEFVEDPGFPTEVRDTTAAGEAFNAGVLYAMQEGFDAQQTLRFANAVASIFLKNKGQYGSLAQVQQLMAQR